MISTLFAINVSHSLHDIIATFWYRRLTFSSRMVRTTFCANMNIRNWIIPEVVSECST